MRALLMLLFFGGSLAVALWSYQLGQKYKDCGCGCDASFEVVPNYVTFYFNDDYKHMTQQNYEFCNVIGYNAPRVPLFLDLYALAGILFLLGIFVATKEESSLV